MSARPRTIIWVRYWAAILAVAIAGGVTHALSDVLSSSLALLFIAAVMLLALYAGRGPALLASFLGATAFFFITPNEANAAKGEYLLQLAVFICVALLISWLSSARRESDAALRRAHAELEDRVRERTAALDAAVVKLQAEVAERRRVEQQILSYQTRLRSLASELSVSEERERRRLAETLHDALGHRLAVAVMKMRSLLQSEDLDGSAKTITRACELVEEAIEHARSLTLQLSPPILFELGLIPALEWLAGRMEADHRLRVHVSDLGGPFQLDDEQRSFLFSAIRELLMNVVKHAGASNAWVTTQFEDDVLQIEIEDDGKGCDSDSLKAGSSSGFGIFNIRERLAHLEGELDVSAAPGRGCRAVLRMPVRVVSAKARPM